MRVSPVIREASYEETPDFLQDCNKVGQGMNQRIAELGARCICEMGEADERTGLEEVEPWMQKLLTALSS